MLRTIGDSTASVRGGHIPRKFAPLAIVVVVLCASQLFAQLPQTQLNTIFPPGGKQGTTIDVTISGGDLDDATEIFFSHPGITAKAQMSEATDFEPARPVPNQFTVSIAADVPPGFYEARVVGRFGVSNPRVFAVGLLNEVTEEGGNQFAAAKEVAIGTVVNGRADASNRDYFKIVLEAGQRVIIDCSAQRIDSRLDAIMTILDAEGTELVQERDTIGVDPMIDFTAPDAGPYIIAIQDSIFGGGGEHYFRLAVHAGPIVDFVFPPSGVPGSNAKYTVYGRNLPGGAPAEEMTSDGKPLEKLTVDIPLPGGPVTARQLAIASFAPPHAGALDGTLFQLKTAQGEANPVTIFFADAPVVLEAEPNDDPQKVQQVALPCEIAGQFYPERDEDWYQFEAKKGEVYIIDVISHRMGLYTDPYFMLQRVTKNDQGEENVQEIAQVDDPGDRNNRIGTDFDTSTDDPSYRFQVPDDGTYRIRVRDQVGDARSDPRYIYRLLIRPELPDLRLVALPLPNRVANNNQVPIATATVRKGGTTLIEVRVERLDGFNEEVEILVEGLPAGVTCPGAVVGPSSNTTWLVVSAAEDAAGWTGSIQIMGKSTRDGKEILRKARAGSVVWSTGNRQQEPADFRLTRDFALSVVDKEVDAALAVVGEAKIYETSLGGNLEIPIQLTRRGEYKADLKLTPVGVPNEFKPKDVDIKGNASDGKLEIAIANANTKPEAYTFYLRGDAKFNYVRNPDAITEAQEEQKRLDELLKKLNEDLKTANEAKAAADKAAQDAANALKQAEQAKQTAEAEAKKAAEEAANANADQKADAEAKSKAAAEKLAAAEKALTEAQTNATKANEAKTAADKTAADADAKVKAATQVKQAADKRVTDAQNANKPNPNMTISVISTAIRLRIHKSPIGLSVPAPGSALKQNEKIEVPFKIERLYGFAEQVDLTFEPPKDAAGLTVQPVSLNKDQADGKFEVAANDKATPGEHTVTVRAKGKFNNVNVETTQEIVLKVEAVEKAE